MKTGDLQTAADHYGMMRHFLRMFAEHSPGLIPHIHRYGDHAAPVGIPRAPADSQLIAALNFYAAADRFTDFARALGRDDDVRWSRELAARIREAVVKKYYDAGRHIRPRLEETPLTFAEASQETPGGLAQTSWKKQDGTLSINVTIPANATGRLMLPPAIAHRLRWTNAPAGAAIPWENGSCLLPCGQYRFTAITTDATQTQRHKNQPLPIFPS